ncbi:hypothetical protein AGMMS50229_04720 [Campylobacterota bacterium]|nr:hypothetical protein AGMMS50229_04720 [Campylobacterota bacterium]
MGILDSTSSENRAAQIKPFVSAVVRETDNVPHTLKELALLHGISTRDIDFVVSQTQTLIKLPEKEKPIELTPQLIGRISDERLLNEKDFYIRQIHKIIFRPLPANPDLRIDTEVAANKTLTKAVATIKTTSSLHSFASLREYLVDELNKLKLRHGMIIHLREGSMINDVTALVNKIRINNRVLAPFRITLCDWISPKPTQNDMLVLHYKSEAIKAPSENDRIDYAERGFIKAVEAGDLLVEYIKPKAGEAGRNFRGKFIPALEPRVRFSPILEPDFESIDVKEDDYSITYFAKKRGYVTFRQRESRLFIGDTLEIESVDFKTTGNINAGTDKDVKISIKGGDAFEDHIGPNTKIEASEIEVTGSVASGAQIIVEKLNVEGQTHATSKIFAKIAHIAVHRGTLEGEEVKIDRLEHGKISAEIVEVDRVIGGIIRAKRITIGTLYSHATLIASERIEIGQLVGGENRLYIEAAVSNAERARFSVVIEENKLVERSLNELSNRYGRKHAMLLRNKDQAEQIRERIESDRARARVPPTILVDRYKQYLSESKALRILREELDAVREQHSQLQDEITRVQNRVFSAVVINQDEWRNYNEIHFRLIAPPKEILFVPVENKRVGEIRLVPVGLEDYVVKADE